MSPVLGGAESTQPRFTVQGPPSAPVVDEPVPASGFDTLPGPPASVCRWLQRPPGPLASVSPLLDVVPSTLASSVALPPSAAAAGATPESSLWFWEPKPGTLEDCAHPADSAAQRKTANASRVVDRTGMSKPPREWLMPHDVTQKSGNGP